MRYFLTLGIVAFSLFGAHAEASFDASCFREYASLVTKPGIVSVGVQNIDDDIFFISSGNILPARMDTTQKNPPVSYTSSDTDELNKLQDSDPYTAIELDPYQLAREDQSYTFDLGKVYPKDTITPSIGYSAMTPVIVSISVDGSGFIPVDIYRIGAFEFRYLRITFQKTREKSDIARFHTLSLYQKIQSRYTVDSPGGPIDIYASYNCQQGKYPDYRKLRQNLDSREAPSQESLVVFSSNPSYRDDTDSDTLPNLLDNCPMIYNPDQKDRNRDGYGDLCSDDDGDGVSGTEDNCPTISNSDQQDKNVNSIGDACEFDTDGDSIPDGTDNAIHEKNPDQKDSDSDSIGDVIDNCTLYNPDQLDLDKNGKGDMCDRDIEYRKTNDKDKDGILDFSDNCPKGANPDQLDTDRDGVGDVCDNCRGLQNKDQSDSDENGIGDACEDIDQDGVEGWRDNCPSVWNPDQSDNDNNRVGNACTDTDRDGIYDATDTCPTLGDPDQSDIDQDGSGDRCDNTDDRFLESNKHAFMGLIALFSLLFIGGIFLLIRKLL